MAPRKLTFAEALETAIVFLVDQTIEARLDAKVQSLLETVADPRLAQPASITPLDLATLLAERSDALDVILKDLTIPEERFQRIVSLLRRIGRVPGPFDREWALGRIKRSLRSDPQFASTIAALLLDGSHDPELGRYLPSAYLETLNYREIGHVPLEVRKVRYRAMLIGTYAAEKGRAVEDRIRGRLLEIERNHGIAFASGRSRFVDTTIDFAVPTVDDPWVIIMSSFQETTSSGQSTKARDMLSAYERVVRSNSVHGENRAFVNFVDGGGWLARKQDLQRLWEHCHYFVNLHHLDMLEAIVAKHVPRRYITAFPS